MSVHDRVDTSKWVAEFPLARLRDEARAFVQRRRQELPQHYATEKAVEDHIRLLSPKWEIVVGPAGVAINEQLRDEAPSGEAYLGRRVPVDVGVWAKGEPVNRAVTKIGGLPYRPPGLAWPIDAAGNAMRFIAQLCFADSRDLLPPLPGDILLVFGDDDALAVEPERLVFEWWPLALESLMSDMPEVSDGLAAFHAHLHRTDDWDGSIFEGTKIGGVPQFIQDVPDVTGTFIAALGSISVPTEQRHPFVNVAEPRGWSRENDLMIGDMGSLYLFLQADGRMVTVSQCY